MNLEFIVTNKSNEKSSNIIVISYKYDNWSVMEETITRRHSEGSEESQEGDPSASPQDDEEVTIKYTYRDDNSPLAVTLEEGTRDQNVGNVLLLKQIILK